MTTNKSINPFASIKQECYGYLETEIAILLTVLNIIFGALASFGNFLVLLAIYRTPSLHVVSNYFLTSVAFADFVTGFLVHPMLAVRCYKNYWYTEIPFSKAADIMVLQSFTATSFGLCAIAVDRYFAIMRTLQYPWIITTRVCFIVTIFIWTTSITYPFTRLLITDPFKLPRFWLLICIVSVGIPLSIIGYCYFKVFKVAREQTRKIAAQCIDKENALTVAKHHKGARTVAIVIGNVLLFWCPAVVISIVQILGDDCLKTKIMKAWFWGIFFAMANSTINPWIYAARMNHFRKAMKKIILFWKY